MAIKLAKSVSASLKYPEVRSFLKTEVNRRFDGDYNVLFDATRDKKLTISGENLRTQNITFEQLLTGEASSARIDQEVLLTPEFLDSLNKINPLIQIAIPSLTNAAPLYLQEL